MVLRVRLVWCIGARGSGFGCFLCARWIRCSLVVGVVWFTVVWIY